MKPSANPTILDYRTAGSDRELLVAQKLFAGEALSTVAVVAKLAAGLGLCLIGPLFVTGIVYAVEGRLGGRALPGFWATFLLLCLVLIPLLMWLERRTRGKFLDDSLAGESAGYSSYGEFELRSTTFLWTVYTEIALQGPRLLWGVIDWWSGRQSVSEAFRLAAAALAVELYDNGQGSPVVELVRPGRPRSVLYPAIRYLVWRDWADLSSRKDRVWLRTPARATIDAILRSASAAQPPARLTVSPR
jgi:hypothetical protein